MEKLKLVSLKNIKIKDSFWDRYLRLVPEVEIPYQWDILNDNLEGVETSHCISNFKIAAGREEGEFYGAVFQDSDVAKWLEALSYVLMSKRDPEWEACADEVIDLIGEAQWADGYINTYYTIKEKGKRFTNLKEGHELYTAGHLMEAATAYYRATGKDKFLRIMIKFADLICTLFSDENNSRAYPGHQEIEIGLIKMYEATGNEKYLKQAKAFLERRGRIPDYFEEEKKNPAYRMIFPELEDYDRKYAQTHLPVRQQKTAEGHAVRAVYMYSAMADIAAFYKDADLLNVCRTLWENIVGKRMYITGSIGSSGLLERFTTDYDLPNNCNYSESCASVGLALFSRRMAQITGEARYMDIAELALYNTVLAGISMDGRSFFYVNPLEVWPENCLPRTSKEHVKPVRQKWFGVACCPPNIARTLASLGEYAVFQNGADVYWNLYLGTEVTLDLDGHRTVIRMETEFPAEGEVKLTVLSDKDYHGNLFLRIPHYVKRFDVSSCGRKTEYEGIKGYAKIPLDGERQELHISMDIEPRVIRSSPRVRENIGKAAVMRGPLVYCLEEQDNGKNLPGIYLDPGSLRECYREDILGGVTEIRASGLRAVETGWPEEDLYSEEKICWKRTELTFIPYAYWCNRTPGEMLVWVKELQKFQEGQNGKDQSMGVHN